MNNVIRIVSDILEQKSSKSAEEIAQLVDDQLASIGVSRVREEWTETKNDSSCSSCVAVRTCYRVNHGDGTYSKEWCGDWHCY
jgi:hypothetical protein